MFEQLYRGSVLPAGQGQAPQRCPEQAQLGPAPSTAPSSWQRVPSLLPPALCVHPVHQGSRGGRKIGSSGQAAVGAAGFWGDKWGLKEKRFPKRLPAEERRESGAVPLAQIAPGVLGCPQEPQTQPQTQPRGMPSPFLHRAPHHQHVGL